MPGKIKVLVLYAHEDRELQQRLKVQLSSLVRQDILDLYDDVVSPGTERKRTINANLDNCQLIILLISPYFTDSDDCYCDQMQRAVERHKSGDVRVIPVILRPTHWHTAPFNELQALPTNGRALTDWRNRDKAYYQVAEGIRQAIEEYREQHLPFV